MLDSVRVELDERNSELAVKRQESTSLLATIDELQVRVYCGPLHFIPFSLYKPLMVYWR